MKDQYAELERIRALDPERDYVTIYRTTVRLRVPVGRPDGVQPGLHPHVPDAGRGSGLVATGELTERTQPAAGG